MIFTGNRGLRKKKAFRDPLFALQGEVTRERGSALKQLTSTSFVQTGTYPVTDLDTVPGPLKDTKLIIGRKIAGPRVRSALTPAEVRLSAKLLSTPSLAKSLIQTWGKGECRAQTGTWSCCWEPSWARWTDDGSASRYCSPAPIAH